MESAASISRRFRRAAEKLPAEMMVSEEENAADAFETILKFSSGEITSVELAALGHPYGLDYPGGARGAGGIHGPPVPRAAPQDPAIINEQSGDFIRSWHKDGPKRLAEGNIATEFENISEHAHFLETGTVLMIARPLIEAVEKEIEPRVQERRDAAIDRALASAGGG